MTTNHHDFLADRTRTYKEAEEWREERWRRMDAALQSMTTEKDKAPERT